MIQLATAPNPSRMGMPPAANDDRAHAFEFKRSRTGHAWPFISRLASPPPRRDAADRPHAADSGS
jgi:hypothetical protein